MDRFKFEEPILELETQIRDLAKLQETKEIDLSVEIKSLRAKLERKMKEVYDTLTPYERVMVARHPNRPQAQDYLNLIVKDFLELHGDRCFSDDRAIVCGVGSLDGEKILWIGNQKGRTTKEKIVCNFGSAHPEGYRKALLKMKMAEKYGLPVVCLVDTPGAYPGIGAEERGIAQAIAVNLMEMARLRTPIVVVVIGEGGSGGAIGIGVGDRFLMLENSYYSVITPEGCAAILWRNASFAADAAKALRLTASDLREAGIADEIIPEPLGGAHRNPERMAALLKERILKNLAAVKSLPLQELVERRYRRLRAVGKVVEPARA